MSKHDELILTIDRVGLAQFGILERFKDTNVIKVTQEIKDALSDSWVNNGNVLRRGDCEENLMLIQPIPYLAIKQDKQIFTYKRLSGSGEERLHNKISVGIGGHCNLEEEHPSDFDYQIAKNLFRELQEEVKITLNDKEIGDKELEFLSEQAKTIGLGYNEEDEVNAVHIGIFKVLELPSEYNVSVKETDTLEGKFVPIEILKLNELDNLENWTRDLLTVLED